MRLFFLLLFTGLSLFSQNNIQQYKKMLDEALKMQEQQQGSGEMDIRIERVKGDVKIITSSEEEVSLTDNYQYPLEAGDVIKTGYDGYAQIFVNNIGIIGIDRNTEFEISEPSNDMIFTLDIGAIVSKFENLIKNKMSLKIKTPSAVIGIRGTEFGVEYSKFGEETTAGVFDEGEISVYPGETEDENQAIKIGKNMEVSLNPSSKRAKVIKMAKLMKYRRNIIEARKNIIKHKKYWKRFDRLQRQKYREMLFKKRNNTLQKNGKKQRNIKNKKRSGK